MDMKMRRTQIIIKDAVVVMFQPMHALEVLNSPEDSV